MRDPETALWLSKLRAAPEMFAALKEAVSQLNAAAARLRGVEGMESFADDTDRVADDCRAALVLARGAQPMKG